MHRKKNHYRHNYVGGMYNDYNYRPEKYSQIKGSVCVNNLEFDGIVFGEFMCPVEGYNYDETVCCGLPNEEYCCSPVERQAQLNNPNYMGPDDDESYMYDENSGPENSGPAYADDGQFPLELTGDGVPLNQTYDTEYDYDNFKELN
jgi:hypothetical protein